MSIIQMPRRAPIALPSGLPTHPALLAQGIDMTKSRPCEQNVQHLQHGQHLQQLSPEPAKSLFLFSPEHPPSMSTPHEMSRNQSWQQLQHLSPEPTKPLFFFSPESPAVTSTPPNVSESPSNNVQAETLDMIAKARQELLAPPSTVCSPFSPLPSDSRTSCISPSQKSTPPHAPKHVPLPQTQPAHALAAKMVQVFQPPAGRLAAIPGLPQMGNKLPVHEQKTTHEQVTALEQQLAGVTKERDQLQDRCADLEQQIAAAQAQDTSAGALRTQLAAYAVEVDSLRDERERLFLDAGKEQNATQLLAEENNELLLRVSDLEQSKQELQMCLDDEIECRKEADERLREVQQEFDAQHRDQCDLGTADLERTRSDVERLRGELDAARENIIGLKSEVESYRRDATRERDRGDNLESLVEPMQKSLASLQEGLVYQSQEFSLFAARTRERQQEFEQLLLIARREARMQDEVAVLLRKELEDLCCSRHKLQSSVAESERRARDSEEELLERQRELQAEWHSRSEETEQRARKAEELWLAQQRELHDSIHALQEHLSEELRQKHSYEIEVSRQKEELHKRSAGRLRRLNRDPALVRLERALKRNIARDMYELQQGTILEKVHERNCKREARLVVVSTDDMLLRWSGNMQKLGRAHTRLDLYEVIRIHFGSMNRACVLHTDIPPWLCFSLYTSRRSYDFVCPDEQITQRFVLCLSRLCDWASGRVDARCRFVRIKAWCKLENHCFQHQTTLAQLFCDAIERTAKQRGLASGVVGAAGLAHDEVMPPLPDSPD